MGSKASAAKMHPLSLYILSYGTGSLEIASRGSGSPCACLIPPYSFFYSFSSFLKNGIKKTRHPAKKKQLPNIDQKLPILAIQNPTAETVKSIHPKKLIV